MFVFMKHLFIKVLLSDYKNTLTMFLTAYVKCMWICTQNEKDDYWLSTKICLARIWKIICFILDAED